MGKSSRRCFEVGLSSARADPKDSGTIPAPDLLRPAIQGRSLAVKLCFRPAHGLIEPTGPAPRHERIALPLASGFSEPGCEHRPVDRPDEGKIIQLLTTDPASPIGWLPSGAAVFERVQLERAPAVRIITV